MPSDSVADIGLPSATTGSRSKRRRSPSASSTAACREVPGSISMSSSPPRRQAIAVIEPIYREMLAIEQSVGPAKAPDASVAFLLDKLKSMGTTYDQFILSL